MERLRPNQWERLRDLNEQILFYANNARTVDPGPNSTCSVQTLFRPVRLASKSAASARPTRAAGCSPGRAWSTPIDTVTWPTGCTEPLVADAKPAETALVRDYGADHVVERSEDSAAAIRRVISGGVDALLDTAVLREKASGAIRDGGTHMPVRGWVDTPAERDIAIKPVLVYEAFERTEWLELLRDAAETGAIQLRVAGEYAVHQVADAQRALAAGGLRGRPVIVF